jgi:DNA-directed RNA polymerase specialized sigma24 family protein
VSVRAEQVDWDGLSPSAKATLRQIIFREAELGWTRQEIADELHLTAAEMGKRMSEVRAELRAQAEKGS